jgi:hypothetical protein
MERKLPPTACTRVTATKKVITVSLTEIGMYDQDPYGEEIEGGDLDKNDGLNALVRERIPS